MNEKQAPKIIATIKTSKATWVVYSNGQRVKLPKTPKQ